MQRHRPDRRGERGSGSISAVFGLMMFLAMLTLAVNVVLSLYTRSLVSAAAYDAARRVAEEGRLTPEAADRHVRSLLGRMPARVTIRSQDPDTVTVEVRVSAPLVLWRRIGPVNLGDITKVATVRREEAR